MYAFKLLQKDVLTEKSVDKTIALTIELKAVNNNKHMYIDVHMCSCLFSMSYNFKFGFFFQMYLA